MCGLGRSKATSYCYLVRPAGLVLWPGDLADGLGELGLFLPTVGAQSRHIPWSIHILRLGFDPSICGSCGRELYHLGALIFLVILFSSFSGSLRRSMD